MKNLNNNSGFSLVEVMMALGISSTVALGGTYLFKASTQNSQSRLVQSENLNIMSRLLQSRKLCKNTLTGKRMMDPITAVADNNLYRVGNKFEGQGILKSMQLIPNPNKTIGPGEYGPASIKIVFEDKNKLSTKLIPVSVQLDSFQRVESCAPKTSVASNTTGKNIYDDICLEVVKGSLSGSKCRWNKRTEVIYVYIPAPEPDPEPVRIDDVYSCYGAICDLYQDVFGRAPDAGGKAFWEEAAKNMSLDDIRRELAGSKEATGEAWDKNDWDNYEKDVTGRGMDLGSAQERCGVDRSC